MIGYQIPYHSECAAPQQLHWLATKDRHLLTYFGRQNNAKEPPFRHTTMTALHMASPAIQTRCSSGNQVACAIAMPSSADIHTILCTEDTSKAIDARACLLSLPAFIQKGQRNQSKELLASVTDYANRVKQFVSHSRTYMQPSHCRKFGFSTLPLHSTQCALLVAASDFRKPNQAPFFMKSPLSVGFSESRQACELLSDDTDATVVDIAQDRQELVQMLWQCQQHLHNASERDFEYNKRDKGALLDEANNLVAQCIGGDSFKKLEILMPNNISKDEVISSCALLSPLHKARTLNRNGAIQIESAKLQLLTPSELQALSDHPECFGQGLLMRLKQEHSDKMQSTHPALSCISAKNVWQPTKKGIGALLGGGSENLLLHTNNSSNRAYMQSKDSRARMTCSAHDEHLIPILTHTPVPQFASGQVSSVLHLKACNDFVCGVDRRNSQLLVLRDRPLKQSVDNKEALRASADKLLQSHETIKQTLQALCLQCGESTDYFEHITPDTYTEYADYLEDPQPSELPNNLLHLATVLPTTNKAKLVQLLRQTTELEKDLSQQSPQANDYYATLTASHLSNTLYPITDVTPLAAGSAGKCTNNRAVMLVSHSNSRLPDAHVVFVDRATGTDPEFASNDARMRTEQLRSASSVRKCIGMTSKDHIRKITRCRTVNCAPTFMTNKGQTHSLEQKANINVTWTDAEGNLKLSMLSLNTTNRLRSDTNSSQPTGRIVTMQDSDDTQYAAYNPRWGLKHLITNTI